MRLLHQRAARSWVRAACSAGMVESKITDVAKVEVDICNRGSHQRTLGRRTSARQHGDQGASGGPDEAYNTNTGVVIAAGGLSSRSGARHIECRILRVLEALKTGCVQVTSTASAETLDGVPRGGGGMCNFSAVAPRVLTHRLSQSCAGQPLHTCSC